MAKLPLATICWHLYFYCIHLKMANNFTTTFCIKFVALGYHSFIVAICSVCIECDHWNKYQHSVRWIQNKCSISMKCWILNMKLVPWSLYLSMCYCIINKNWNSHLQRLNDKSFFGTSLLKTKYYGLEGVVVFVATF